MDEPTRKRLLSVIESSESVLVEDGDSADLVASRRVAEALARKAQALRQLGRFDDAAAVWDELIVRYAKEPPVGAPFVAIRASLNKAGDLDRAGRHGEALDEVAVVLELCEHRDETEAVERLIAGALAVKARASVSLGRVDDALGCDEQMVARFAAAGETELRQWVAGALEHQAWVLIRDGRIDDALAVSEQLVARLADESAESLPMVAEVISRHILLLLNFGRPSKSAVARSVVEMLVNASGAAINATASTVMRHQPLPARWLPGARRLRSIGRSISGTAVLDSFIQRRHRAQQALRASRTLIARIGDSDDPELRRLAATAEVTAGAALAGLGHIRAGFGAIGEISERDDADSIQAVQRLADYFGHGNSVVEQLGAVSFLSFRARMLGRGDPDVTKIAYEDSIADRRAIPPHARTTPLLANLLRPNAKRKPRPTHPTDADPRDDAT